MTGIEEDYELLPRQEVENLRKEIDKLKKNPIGTTKQGEDLLTAVNNLNNNINKLINIFTNAEADLAKEYAENNPINDIKNIKEQNEQIAQGILAVADMVKDIKKQNVNVPQPNFSRSNSLEDFNFPEGNMHEPINPQMLTDAPPPPQRMPNQSQPMNMNNMEQNFNPAPQQPFGMRQGIPPPPPIQQPRKGLFSRR